MSIQKVRDYVKIFNEHLEPIEFTEKTNTVEEAAKALGVEGAQIAKSILFKTGNQFGLFVTAGDIRINQKKVKKLLGPGKPKLASPKEVEEITGFPIGGVCPFALNEEVPIFLDESMNRFEKVYTAAGTPHSALPITFTQLCEITKGTVIDAENID
ncbi:prolyl-tRNA editing enzyme YbaK/EbsC (Cys-tRNA(Pro) deacylase) [Peribacillus deserti]|uniref:Prolyl-tRNA editing enzyme YbaK/EbsC (Cys-tRNA(Pro) deacylase) n=1 Tax=Peribacillus deserti TaxID=673318 RepID=A0ABS2QMZ3_9BACI|nr:YbaK/EbsC family protein [Peribacillus deserti]MBM7694531.1 prolyl-tRNA editing enzyme YbaK/EbsC (Cys-tRNA(Pro) deacylase) [Peribacillus deserti]